MTDENIQKLTMIEQSLANLIAQKQSFQKQSFEIEHALKELVGKEYAYQLVGPIMVKKPSSEIAKSLQGQKETVKIRLLTIEKQEVALRAQAKSLQEQILKKT